MATIDFAKQKDPLAVCAHLSAGLRSTSRPRILTLEQSSYPKSDIIDAFNKRREIVESRMTWLTRAKFQSDDFSIAREGWADELARALLWLEEYSLKCDGTPFLHYCKKVQDSMASLSAQNIQGTLSDDGRTMDIRYIGPNITIDKQKSEVTGFCYESLSESDQKRLFRATAQSLRQAFNYIRSLKIDYKFNMMLRRAAGPGGFCETLANAQNGEEFFDLLNRRRKDNKVAAYLSDIRILLAVQAGWKKDQRAHGLLQGLDVFLRDPDIPGLADEAAFFWQVYYPYIQEIFDGIYGNGDPEQVLGPVAHDIYLDAGRLASDDGLKKAEEEISIKRDRIKHLKNLIRRYKEEPEGFTAWVTDALKLQIPAWEKELNHLQSGMETIRLMSDVAQRRAVLIQTRCASLKDCIARLRDEGTIAVDPVRDVSETGLSGTESGIKLSLRITLADLKVLQGQPEFEGLDIHPTDLAVSFTGPFKYPHAAAPELAMDVVHRYRIPRADEPVKISTQQPSATHAGPVVK